MPSHAICIILQQVSHMSSFTTSLVSIPMELWNSSSGLVLPPVPPVARGLPHSSSPEDMRRLYGLKAHAAGFEGTPPTTQGIFEGLRNPCPTFCEAKPELNGMIGNCIAFDKSSALGGKTFFLYILFVGLTDV